MLSPKNEAIFRTHGSKFFKMAASGLVSRLRRNEEIFGDKCGNTLFSNTLVFGGTPENPTVQIGGINSFSKQDNHSTKSSELNASCSYGGIEISETAFIDAVAKSNVQKAVDMPLLP